MVEINIQFRTQFCLPLTLKRSTEHHASTVPAGTLGWVGVKASRAIRFQISFCAESPQDSRFLVSGGSLQQWAPPWNYQAPNIPAHSRRASHPCPCLSQSNSIPLELSLYLCLLLFSLRHLEKWAWFSTVVMAPASTSPSWHSLLVLQIASFLGVIDLLTMFLPLYVGEP